MAFLGQHELKRSSDPKCFLIQKRGALRQTLSIKQLAQKIALFCSESGRNWVRFVETTEVHTVPA